MADIGSAPISVSRVLTAGMASTFWMSWLTCATVAAAAAVAAQGYEPRPRPLPVRTTESEMAAHLAFLQANLKDRSLWEAYGLDMEKASAA